LRHKIERTTVTTRVSFRGSESGPAKVNDVHHSDMRLWAASHVNQIAGNPSADIASLE